MPIHMEKDPEQPRRDDDNRPPGPRRGGGGLTQLLPFLLTFLFRKPKLLIPVLLIGGLIYFMGGFGGGGSSFTDGGGGGGIDPNLANFGLGMEMKQEVYDKAEVFEPLASNVGNPLPNSFSLIKYAPQRLNQGRQGSCVGWASAYAARTILHSRASGQNPNRVPFSPSYLYNQIALQGCQGAYMLDAMENLRKGGVLPFQDFKYDEGTCRRQPNRSEATEASQFRTRGYNRLTQGANKYKTDMLAIKQNLAQGAPVVIGMQVGGSFTRNMYGKELWRPTQSDMNMRGFGGHAMCVIGYDDYKFGNNMGGFEIMNSWGPEWGKNGVAWVSYRDFDYFVKEAYGLYPMGNANKNNANKFAVKFGLMNTKTEKLIPMSQAGGNVFRADNPIAAGDKFKILVTNTIECYTYIFSEMADGSSKTLFPYTNKHSPFCGITGTRLFPKDYSMVADNVGQRDRIAVVVSKEPLDYNKVNNRINASRAPAFASKVKDALSGAEVENVKFEAGEAIGFECDTKGKNVVGVVLEFDKR